MPTTEWYAYVSEGTGALYALALDVIDPLPSDLYVRDSTYTQDPTDQSQWMFDHTAQRFVPRDDQVPCDRMDDLAVLPQYADWQAAFLASPEAHMKAYDAIVVQLGDMRYRAYADPPGL